MFELILVLKINAYLIRMPADHINNSKTMKRRFLQ